MRCRRRRRGPHPAGGPRTPPRPGHHASAPLRRPRARGAACSHHAEHQLQPPRIHSGDSQATKGSNNHLLSGRARRARCGRLPSLCVDCTGASRPAVRLAATRSAGYAAAATAHSAVRAHPLISDPPPRHVASSAGAVAAARTSQGPPRIPPSPGSTPPRRSVALARAGRPVHTTLCTSCSPRVLTEGHPGHLGVVKPPSEWPSAGRARGGQPPRLCADCAGASRPHCAPRRHVVRRTTRRAPLQKVRVPRC